MSIYEKMVTIAETLKPKGYLRAYEADLTKHDAGQLANAKPGARYVWILRENGTQLFEVATGRDAAWVTYWLNNAHNPPNLTFLATVDTGEVRPISYDRARELAKIPHPEGKVIKFSLS